MDCKLPRGRRRPLRSVGIALATRPGNKARRSSNAASGGSTTASSPKVFDSAADPRVQIGLVRRRQTIKLAPSRPRFRLRTGFPAAAECSPRGSTTFAAAVPANPEHRQRATAARAINATPPSGADPPAADRSRTFSQWRHPVLGRPTSVRVRDVERRFGRASIGGSPPAPQAERMICIAKKRGLVSPLQFAAHGFQPIFQFGQRHVQRLVASATRRRISLCSQESGARGNLLGRKSPRAATAAAGDTPDRTPAADSGSGEYFFANRRTA